MPKAEINVVPTWEANQLISKSCFSKLVNAYCLATMTEGHRACQYAPSWFIDREDYVGTSTNHLNANGYKALANYIISFVKGWDGLVVSGWSNATFASGYSGIAISRYVGFDAEVYIYIENFNYVGNTTLFTLDHSVTVGNVMNLPVTFSRSGQPNTQCNAYITSSGTFKLSNSAASGTGVLTGLIKYPRWTNMS